MEYHFRVCKIIQIVARKCPENRKYWCFLKWKSDKNGSTWILKFNFISVSKKNFLYNWSRNVLSWWFLAGNQSNHQNFDPTLLTNELWHVFMGIKEFFDIKTFKSVVWFNVNKTWNDKSKKIIIFGKESWSTSYH